MAATAVLWGSAFPAIRIALEGYSPTAIAVWRLAVGLLPLIPLALIGRVRPPRAADLPRLAAFGLTGMTAYQLLLYAGERHVEGGTAAMLVATSPVFATALGMLVLRERPGPRGVAGLVIALGGALVVAMTAGDGGGSHAGMALIVLAAAAQATSFILQKPLLNRYSGVECVFYGSLFALLPLLFFAPGAVHQAVAAGAGQSAAVVWLGVGCTALAFATWSGVLRAVPASTGSLVLYAVPVAALALDAVLLGALPTPLAGIGGLIVLAGVAVAATRRPPAAGTAPREPARVQQEPVTVSPEPVAASPEPATASR
ncbi:DMT family transporter [Streptomyces sp. URMC 123]|uniref:DMT family transporter n=1 Tax=Streptomyces sp. URMC 123 TaxID=3423403 RepID=UPI003F1D9BC2